MPYPLVKFEKNAIYLPDNATWGIVLESDI